MSGARFGLSNFLVLAVLLVIALGLVFLLRQPNDGSGTPSPSGANPASPGSPVPSITPQQTTVAQETATPQETGTPWYVELSPAVSNEQTHEAEGGEPTPNATQLAQMEESALEDSLGARSGTVIAHGTNQTPTAQGLTTYRIEEVPMTGTVSLNLAVPNPFSAGWKEQRVTFDRFWRLTVTGTGVVNLPMTDSAIYTIWVNGRKVGGGTVYSDTHEVSTIVFDRSWLPEGGRIAVATTDFMELSHEVPDTIHYSRR